MTESQIMRDDSDLRKYRTEIPNMADDDLDPFQYRLYAHYKRVCGANAGSCYEGVRTTAEKTKMSNEKVISTRQWLADHGWIELEQRAKGIFHIAIIDRWGENFARYSERKTVRNSEQSKPSTVRNSEQSTRRPLEIPNSTVRNSEQSPLEISNERKNHIKNEPIEEECVCVQAEAPQPARTSPPPLSASSSTSTGDPFMDAAKKKFERGGRSTPSWQADMNLRLKPDKRVPLVNAIGKACGLSAMMDGREDILRDVHDAACWYYEHNYDTPEKIDALHKVYLTDDWRRKNHPRPSLETFMKFASKQLDEIPTLSPNPTTVAVPSPQNYGDGIPEYMRDNL